MRRVHILGRKNHGKTTLVTELIGELSRRGHRVGSIKHTHHRHELDTPGKDSHLHRQAGAQCVGILSPELNAVFWRPADTSVDPYAAFAASFRDCDLVLVEGDTQTTAIKLEVWRSALGVEPLLANDPSIRCLITDDSDPQPEHPAERLSRQDLSRIADWIEKHVLLSE